MAKVVFLAPPLPELHTSHNINLLTPVAQVIQSMRGIASTVSFLIPAWHFLLSAETANSHDQSDIEYPRRVTTSFMKEGMLELVLLHLRRIFDESDRSLACGTIVRHLSTESVRKALNEYCLQHVDPKLNVDVIDFKISGLIYQCAPHVVSEIEIEQLDPRFTRTARQTALLKRAANKRVAHITLDDFEIDLETLHDLVMSVLNISLLIHSLIGGREGLAHFREIDQAAYDQSATMLGAKHNAGLLCDVFGRVEAQGRSGGAANTSTPPPSPQA